MPALAFTSALLLGAIRSECNSHQYLWSASHVSDWRLEIDHDDSLEVMLCEEQAEAFSRWETWGKWTPILHALHC